LAKILNNSKLRERRKSGLVLLDLFFYKNDNKIDSQCRS
jgi:hypothetical protein